MAKLFNLSDASSIAIHAMVLVAKSDKPLNVIHIAEVTNTSKHHVAKVMQRLVKDGFVISQRGPAGGFMLNREPSEITFLDVYESIEGKVNTPHCVFNTPVCPLDRCIMNSITHKMTSDFLVYMRSQTLAMYIS